MCGIFGFTGPPDPSLLGALGWALRHRGPDGAGSFAGPAASLGCERLAITGVADGAQPLASEDGRLQLVCNGEIYNHRELRRGLEARGHRFATGSDAEVVVHGFEDEGEGFFGHLHGMFALALWDERSRRLTLARDAAGMKPLLYARHAGRWWFASEAKALLAAGGLPRRLDARALDGLLRLGFVPGPETLFAGVRKLPAGHWLRVAGGDGGDGGDGGGRGAAGRRGGGRDVAGEAVPRPFAPPPAVLPWVGGGPAGGSPAPPAAGRGHGAGGLAAELRQRLAAAVESHLAAEVPAGASLSGGLDSSLIVALMAARLGPGVRTFAIGCPGDQDERPFARRVADRFATDHQEIEVGPGDLLQRLPLVVWRLEEPRNGPLVPNDMLFERAAREVRVLLLGEGADELFGGYLRLKTALAPLSWLPPRLAAPLYGTRKIGAAGGLYGPELAAARAAADPLAAHLGPALAHRGPRRLAALLDYERRVQLPNAHLPRVDMLSMAHALEARLPYLDAGVTELAGRVPPAAKVGWRSEKMLLRAAAAGLLPDAILRRRKQGQADPLRLWRRAGLLDLAAELLDAPTVAARGLFQPRAVDRLLARLRRGGGQPFDRNRLQQLVLVEIWHRVFLDPARLEAPMAPMAPMTPMTPMVLIAPMATAPATPTLPTLPTLQTLQTTAGVAATGAPV
jgi:asparagine synthase (glutamine-hydrolysing)